METSKMAKIANKSYVVYKDVPVPPRKLLGRTKGQSKYKFLLDLEVGDHIVAESVQEAAKLTNAMIRLSEGYTTFTQRSLDNGTIGLWVKHMKQRKEAA